MKKLILFLFLTTTLLSYGQKNDISKVTFYGVDFSLVKVFGADESGDQFRYAFEGINRLFMSEPKKYNVSKFLGVQVNGINLEAVDKKNDDMNINELLTTASNHIVTDDMAQEAINQLNIESEEGIGLVFIAEFLDKANNLGYYKAVFFDKNNKEILEILSGKGRAKGFGLRNFWANSIQDMMKRIK